MTTVTDATVVATVEAAMRDVVAVAAAVAAVAAVVEVVVVVVMMMKVAVIVGGAAVVVVAVAVVGAAAGRVASSRDEGLCPMRRRSPRSFCRTRPVGTVMTETASHRPINS